MILCQDSFPAAPVRSQCTISKHAYTYTYACTKISSPKSTRINKEFRKCMTVAAPDNHHTCARYSGVTPFKSLDALKLQHSNVNRPRINQWVHKCNRWLFHGSATLDSLEELNYIQNTELWEARQQHDHQVYSFAINPSKKQPCLINFVIWKSPVDFSTVWISSIRKSDTSYHDFGSNLMWDNQTETAIWHIMGSPNFSWNMQQLFGVCHIEKVTATTTSTFAIYQQQRSRRRRRHRHTTIIHIDK